MTGFLVAILVVGIILFSYLALPPLISYTTAAKLRDEYDLEQRPEVTVTPGFSPALLLGRVGRVEVRIHRMSHNGIEMRNVRANLENVEVSLPGLFKRKATPDIRHVYLSAEVSQESLSQYVRHKDIGLSNGEVRIEDGEVFYRSPNVLFGFPASVRLDLRVAGAGSVAVGFGEILVRGARLPSSLIGGSLPPDGVSLDLGVLPFGAALKRIEPLDGVLVLRAGR